MVFRATAVSLGMVLFASSAFAQVSQNPERSPNGAYQLEERHTQVVFFLKHLDLTDFYGRFDKMSGTLNFDTRHPEASTVSVTLDMSSIDTPNQTLNGELKDVFNVAKFPTATFKSTSIARANADSGKITGDLTLNGITKSVSLDAKFIGGRENPMDGAAALGFSASTTIHRSDFGLDQMIWNGAVGQDVNLVINAMFEQKTK
jgi:polyisoprenoid-binding protein YceI